MSNAFGDPARDRANGLTAAQWGTLAAIWLIYGSCYFCRVNVGAANPGITAELLSAKQMGIVLASFKICYALGQLVNGQMAERFGAKRVLWVGMIGAGLANIAFGLGVGFWSLLAAWALNGFFQAGLWPSCVKIMANWFSPFARGRAMGVLGTSYQLGSAVTMAAMGSLIVAFGGNWRVAFLLPAGAFLLVSIPAALRLRARPIASDSTEPTSSIALLAAATDGLTLRQILGFTLTNRRVWVLGLSLGGLNVARFGYLEWIPSYLLKIQKAEIDAASLRMAILPLGGVLGVLVAGWISDRLFQTRRAPVISVMLAGLGVLTLAFDWTASHGGWFSTVVCLSAIGFCIYGPQVMLVGTAPADLARRDLAAAAVGFVDSLAYVGAAVGSWLTGRLVQDHGWHATMLMWAGTAFAAALLTATLWNARAESHG